MLTTLEKVLFLRQVSLFSEFNARELGIIAQKAEEEGFSRGEIIFHQGDPGDALYLIIGGKVRVIVELENSRETMAVLEERACFGEMAVLTDETRTATVEAADTSTILKIKREDFRELIYKKPEISFPLFTVIIGRLKEATNLYVKTRSEIKAINQE